MIRISSSNRLNASVGASDCRLARFDRVGPLTGGGAKGGCVGGTDGGDGGDGGEGGDAGVGSKTIRDTLG